MLEGSLGRPKIKDVAVKTLKKFDLKAWNLVKKQKERAVIVQKKAENEKKQLQVIKFRSILILRKLMNRVLKKLNNTVQSVNKRAESLRQKTAAVVSKMIAKNVWNLNEQKKQLIEKVYKKKMTFTLTFSGCLSQ